MHGPGTFGPDKNWFMPNITSTEKNGHIGHFVKLEPGEKVLLCRCYKSSTFPLCDFEHQKYENDFGPLIVEALKEQPKAG
jgi:CDGSH-type Zn-finger protein